MINKEIFQIWGITGSLWMDGLSRVNCNTTFANLCTIAIIDIVIDCAIKALNAVLCLRSDINDEDLDIFKKKNIWDSIVQIREMISHRCPQNRTENYPYFGKPNDPNIIVYKDAEGKAAFERMGLLSLTARDDATSPPVTKAAVIGFIHQLVNELIIKLQNELHIKEVTSKNEKKAENVDTMPIVSDILLQDSLSLRELSNHYAQIFFYENFSFFNHCMANANMNSIKQVKETANELKAYGLTEEDLTNTWQRPPSLEPFNGFHKEALIYLISGKPSVKLPDLGSPVPSLPSQLCLSPEEAIKEINHLDSDQVRALQALYFYGLRGTHLRYWQETSKDHNCFTGSHRLALKSLINEGKGIKPKDAIAQIINTSMNQVDKIVNYASLKL